MITVSRVEELDAMIARFEDQYEVHSERLARLATRRPGGRSTVHHVAEIESCRRALADTARMLRRAADHDFGLCRLCGEDIPIAHLAARPEVVHCDRCDPLWRGPLGTPSPARPV